MDIDGIDHDHRHDDAATENPETLGANFWSFTFADKCVNAIMAIVTISVIFIGGLPWLIGSLVLWYLIMHRHENGRTYYVVISWLKSGYLGLTKSWEAPVSKGKSLKQLASYPIPFTTGTIGDHLGFMGLERCDAIVVTGEGSAIGSKSLQSWKAANDKIADIVRYIAASVPSNSVGVSYVFRRRPANIPQFDASAEKYMAHDVAVPKALVLSHLPEESLTAKERRDRTLYALMVGELPEQIRQMGSEPTRAMVITLDRDKQVADAIKKQQGIPKDELSRLMMLDMAEAVRSGLDDVGVYDPKILNLDELNSYVRGSWDIADLHDYHELEQTGDAEALRRVRNLVPQRRIRPYHNYIVTDNTIHTVLRLTKVPPLTRPDYFPLLFRLPWPWISVALVGAAARSGLEYQVMERVVAIGEIADDKMRASKSSKTERREELRRKREENLAINPYAQAYVILVAVSCPIELDPEVDPQVSEQNAKIQLEEVVNKLVMSRIRVMGCEATRITGRSLQLENLFMATTGIPV